MRRRGAMTAHSEVPGRSAFIQTGWAPAMARARLTTPVFRVIFRGRTLPVAGRSHRVLGIAAIACIVISSHEGPIQLSYQAEQRLRTSFGAGLQMQAGE